LRTRGQSKVTMGLAGKRHTSWRNMLRKVRDTIAVPSRVHCDSRNSSSSGMSVDHQDVQKQSSVRLNKRPKALWLSWRKHTGQVIDVKFSAVLSVGLAC
jgi:hypothetical protein